jgi:hypothetical protein
VRLGPTAVVRLEGPLAHGLAPSQSGADHGSTAACWVGQRARRFGAPAGIAAQVVQPTNREQHRGLNGTDPTPSRSNRRPVGSPAVAVAVGSGRHRAAPARWPAGTGRTRQRTIWRTGG